MNAMTQPLPFDADTLNGLSPKLLNSHHQNNYGGAVKRLNAIREQLAGTTFATALVAAGLGFVAQTGVPR